MITLALAAMCCLGAQAQEKLFQSANVQSPVINNDGTVTFNLFAPKAVKVEVTGDFLPTQQIDVPGYGKYDAPGVAQVEGRKERRVELYHRQALLLRCTVTPSTSTE